MLITPSFDSLAVHVIQPYVVGDTYYANTTTSIIRLPIGTTNQMLKTVGGIPAWGVLDLAASPTSITGILPVANGGTGQSSLYGAVTQIPFMHASTANLFAYSANLTFDGTKLYIGGATSPSAQQIQVFANSVAGLRAQTNSAASTTGTNFSFNRGKGTVASPAVVANGNYIFSLVAGAYSGAAYASVTTIRSVAEVTSDPFYGGRILFQTTTDSDSETPQTRMIITGAGLVRIGGSTDPTVALDVTGAGLFSATLGITGLTTASGGLSNGSKYIGKVTVATDTYVVLTTDETVTGEKATAFAITLFPAVTATIGQRIIIKNLGAGAIIITADTTGAADLIDGVATLVIYQWESAQLVCTAADKWSVI